MTNEFKIISEDGLKTLCKAIKKTSTVGEILDDTNSVTDKTYSSFEIDRRLNTKVDKTDIVDNLTSTDTDKPLSANQGKILNDTKLNKTDANKLNCVTIDNVSLKEYILTNFTETGKTYYLIAKTTCTDLPKVSNFYITVETPGLYTYKVTAKELNDSNGIYACSYRTISSSWTEWQKVLITGDVIANDEVVKKTDISTTINSTSTNDTVPTSKAIYDNAVKSLSKIKKTNTFIKADTGVNTLLEFICNNDFCKDTSAEYVFGVSGFDDLPTTDWGYTIRVYNTGGAINVFAYKYLSNDVVYVRGITADGKWCGGWKRLCTTKVVDVPKTDYSLDTSCDGVYEKGDKNLNNCWYAIRNGWCIVQVDLRCLQLGGGYKRVFTSLPKPIATMANVIMTNDKEIEEGDKPLIIVIGTDGMMKAEGGKIGGRYIGSFSYPVAE